MDVSVIIVSYNTFDLTKEAIDSVFQTTHSLQAEVIVIDNNSPDQSASRLKACYENSTFQVHIVENKENKGFSAANNQGASLAQGQYLFFLNPDTLVHENAIAALVDFIKHHADAGAVGPRVLNTDGTDQISIARFATAWTILLHHLPVLSLLGSKKKVGLQTPAVSRPVDVIKGCALMMDEKVFKDVGGWDERYFMYSEETELCLALVRAGYTNYFVRDAVITHHGGQSSMDYYAEQQVVQQRSALQFLRRHYGLPIRLIHRISGLIGFGVRAIAFPIMALVRPAKASGYRLRGEAASRLFRWFLLEYS